MDALLVDLGTRETFSTRLGVLWKISCQSSSKRARVREVLRSIHSRESHWAAEKKGMLSTLARSQLDTPRWQFYSWLSKSSSCQPIDWWSYFGWRVGIELEKMREGVESDCSPIEKDGTSTESYWPSKFFVGNVTLWENAKYGHNAQSREVFRQVLIFIYSS